MEGSSCPCWGPAVMQAVAPTTRSTSQTSERSRQCDAGGRGSLPLHPTMIDEVQSSGVQVLAWSASPRLGTRLTTNVTPPFYCQYMGCCSGCGCRSESGWGESTALSDALPFSVDASALGSNVSQLRARNLGFDGCAGRGPVGRAHCWLQQFQELSPPGRFLPCPSRTSRVRAASTCKWGPWQRLGASLDPR